MKSFIFLCLISANAFAELPKSASKTFSGRFQLIQLSDMRRDQYMIDSETGRLWHKVCLKQEGEECVATAWRIEMVEVINTPPAMIDNMVKELSK